MSRQRLRHGRGDAPLAHYLAALFASYQTDRVSIDCPESGVAPFTPRQRFIPTLGHAIFTSRPKVRQRYSASTALSGLCLFSPSAAGVYRVAPPWLSVFRMGGSFFDPRRVYRRVGQASSAFIPRARHENHSRPARNRRTPFSGQRCLSLRFELFEQPVWRGQPVWIERTDEPVQP